MSTRSAHTYRAEHSLLPVDSANHQPVCDSKRRAVHNYCQEVSHCEKYRVGSTLEPFAVYQHIVETVLFLTGLNFGTFICGSREKGIIAHWRDKYILK